MQHQRLLFEDIMQQRVLYFDRTNTPACINICNELKIDNLPEVTGNSYYQYTKGNFIKRKLTLKYRADKMQPIFSKNAIQQIVKADHNVLFAYEGNVLRGVVHICDYNSDIVIQHIQDDILLFERLLRQWLVLNGYNSHHMADYYNYKLRKSKGSKDKEFYDKKLVAYRERVNEIAALGEFQIFDFSDLLLFAASNFTNKCHKIDTFKNGSSKHNDPIKLLVQLRNMAMHGKNPVSKDNVTAIYSINSLHILAESLELLSTQYALLSHKVRLHPDYQLAIELENRFKLQIIHEHHPRALEYFLGN
jgi:hypothetical protein